jgi:pimeloyl-ACP methyl ester carboxylesterase
VVAPDGLHVVERGPEDAPRVVLVHGSMDRASGMWAVARRLQGDLRVITYDRRGYAQSRPVGGPFDLATHVVDLVDLLDGRPAAVFGHSLGGDIALAAAEHRPDLVPAVGAYEPPMPWEPWWPVANAGRVAMESNVRDGAGAAAETFMRRMVGDESWERLPAGTKAERRADGPALVGEFQDVRRHPPYDAAEIRVPVLLARGEDGGAQHVRAAEVLAERFGAPGRTASFEMVVVPGARHGVHFQDPDACAALVRRVTDLVRA